LASKPPRLLLVSAFGALKNALVCLSTAALLLFCLNFCLLLMWACISGGNEERADVRR